MLKRWLRVLRKTKSSQRSKLNKLKTVMVGKLKAQSKRLMRRRKMMIKVARTMKRVKRVPWKM